MNLKKKHFLRSLCIVLSLFTIFFCCWLFFSDQSFLNSDRYKSYTSILLLYLLILVILCNVYDTFSIGKRKVIESVYSFLICCLISGVAFYILDTLAFRYFFSFWYIIIGLVLQSIFIVAICKLINKNYYENIVLKKTLVIYDDKSDIEKIKTIYYFDKKYDIAKTEKITKVNDNYKYEKYETIFVTSSANTIREKLIEKCALNNIELYIIPQVSDIIIAGGNYVYESYIPISNISNKAPSSLFISIKRIFDIVASFLAIILLSPFMLITAIAIKLYDGGPAIYSHIRLTKNGKEFKIYKFRSMKVNAEYDGVARLVSENDDRITKIGKFIRAIRFDELPQLFNILKGDMTFVGPRPERPEIVQQYIEKYPLFNLRLQVKAGLTGYAQIYGKYNTEPMDKLKMDLFYINNMSLLFDLKLIFLTLRTILIKDSTESIKEGKITAVE